MVRMPGKWISSMIVAALVFASSLPSGAAPQSEQGNPPRREGRRKKKGPQRYSIEQAMSDRAQLHTIAFSGLAFITGDFGASTFIPPGKVCDFFGFQYMRDVDAAEKGHNPMFLNRVAGNVLHVLNDSQKKLFEELAEEQAGELEKLARMRLPLIHAFHRELSGRLPEGSRGIDRESVKRHVGEIFAMDAALSFRRAEVMGRVAASLTPDQKEYLGKMKFGDFNTWPEMDQRDRRGSGGRNRSRLHRVAYMTYASEFFSWTAGSVEADTYFCPERHGTYFGGFFMKDMPAMGKRDYDISTSLTGESGKIFLNEILKPEQRRLIEGIIESQRDALRDAVRIRRAISTELRGFLKNEKVNRDKVVQLGRDYGARDGEMSWLYVTAFARVNKTLSKEQREALVKLRNLEGYKSAPYYLYSKPAKEALALPDTDFFFFPPKKEGK